MNPLEQILQTINHQRDALGVNADGSFAPTETNAAGATAATGNGTGGAMAPDAQAAADKLAKALKTLHQNESGQKWAALEHFGGKVLGYGEHQTDAAPGHTGKFAIVQRDGDLFHVYRDGHLAKIDQGAVAGALGIKPRVAQIVGAGGGPDPFGALSAAMGNGTGGAMAPAGMAGPRGQDPLEALRRLLHQRA